MAVRKLKLMWQGLGWNSLKVNGKEKKTDQHYNQAKKRNEKFTKAVCKDKVHWHIEFATESYHSGAHVYCCATKKRAAIKAAQFMLGRDMSGGGREGAPPR